MKPVKVVILSCTHGHAKGYYSLANNPLFELLGVSVEKEYVDRALLHTLKPHVPIYETDEELLNAHKDTEAVIIASSNHRHLEQVKLCASRGLHIFSMKIPTFDLEEYDKMIDCVEKAGVKCQVELELRYNPDVLRLRDIYRSGSLGKIYSFTACNLSHNPMWWLPWMGSPEQSYGKRIPLRKGMQIYRGGALADHPHLFDIIKVIFDSTIEFVYMDVAPNMRKDIEVEDLISVVGRLKNGIIFSIDPSFSRTENRLKEIGPGWEQYPKRVEVNMSLHGEKGSVIGDVYGACVHSTGTPSQNFVTHILGHSFPGAPHYMMRDFYRVVRENKAPPVGLKEHRDTIVAMNACYESFYKGEIIYL